MTWQSYIGYKLYDVIIVTVTQSYVIMGKGRRFWKE